MIVQFTKEARADLRAIGDYVAKADPVRAIGLVQALQAKCRQLTELPRGFPLVQGLEKRGVRHRSHGSYLIFYAIKGDAVLILRVLHGARDYAGML
jgi:toxin ParE1/3/4